MGEVIALIRLMPDGVIEDKDLQTIITRVGEVIKSPVKLGRVEVKDIAFGLRGVNVTVSVPDSEGGLEPIVEMFDLKEILSLRPAEVERAAKSRVLYAIEALKEPVITIFDRPENDFNENDRYYLFNILHKLSESRNCGFIIYTRSRSLIEKWAHEIIVLQDGLITKEVDKDSFFLSKK